MLKQISLFFPKYFLYLNSHILVRTKMVWLFGLVWLFWVGILSKLEKLNYITILSTNELSSLFLNWFLDASARAIKFNVTFWIFDQGPSGRGCDEFHFGRFFENTGFLVRLSTHATATCSSRIKIEEVF